MRQTTFPNNAPAANKGQEADAFQNRNPAWGPGTKVSLPSSERVGLLVLANPSVCLQRHHAKKAPIVIHSLPARQPDDNERTAHPGGNAHSLAKTASACDIEPLISFEQALRILGMKERRLRGIIQTTRDRIAGKRTTGPTIRFFQYHPKAAIKFRLEWLEEFIREHTYDPRPSLLPPPELRRRQPKEPETAGFGFQAGTAEPELGFDSQLYDL